MKKNKKKLVGFILTLVMAMSMTMTTMAATINNVTDHTFEAYQIFTGVQAEANTTLGVTGWGEGFDSAQFVTDIAQVRITFAEGETPTAADVAEKLADITDDAQKIKLAKIAYACRGAAVPKTIEVTTEMEPGYYLIVDTTDVGEGDAKNPALLQVANTITIDDKQDAPVLTKKVKENVKYTENGGFGAGYNDVADYNIGDTVPFVLDSKVPANMKYYEAYKFIIHDELAPGLAFDASSVKVTIGTELADNAFTVKTTGLGDGCTFEIEILNFKSYTEGTPIHVEYNATLDTDAVKGNVGNRNKAWLEYSNNPDASKDDDTNETGTTAPDEVIVFTYVLDVTKEDGQEASKKLKGAVFKLYKSDSEWLKVVDNKITWVTTEEDATELVSDVSGKFNVPGLDDGTYYLKETVPPAGYNLLNSPVKVVITATTNNEQNWNGTTEKLTGLTVAVDDGATADGTLATGVVSVTVKNNTGADLPETGGIGTTIFYVVGALLMLFAVILLITKRKMASEK